MIGKLIVGAIGLIIVGIQYDENEKLREKLGNQGALVDALMAERTELKNKLDANMRLSQKDIETMESRLLDLELQLEAILSNFDVTIYDYEKENKAS